MARSPGTVAQEPYNRSIPRSTTPIKAKATTSPLTAGVLPLAVARPRTAKGRDRDQAIYYLAMRYKIALHESEEGFSVSVPGLPEILTLKGYVKRIVSTSDTNRRGSGGMEIFFQYDSEAERARLFAKIERLINENFGEVIGGKIREHLEKR